MVTQSAFDITSPFTKTNSAKTLSLSDIAGHGSFMLLAISYLETDFLQLRLFAVSGVALSIIFQYYREKPLWIPIRWNTLFLVINAVMIVLLLKEENDANNIPAEKKVMYESFAKKGMSPVDFLQLISAAKRVEVKKGEVVVAEHRKNTRVYFIKSGRLSVIKNGTKIREVEPNQFTGEMSFLRWEDRIDASIYQKKTCKKGTKSWQTKDSETELFQPLLIMCEELFERWGLSASPDSESESQLAPAGPASTSKTVRAESALSSEDDDSHSITGLGITLDAHGNVITSGEVDDHRGAEAQSTQEQTVFGRYLNATYALVGGLFSAQTEQANTEDTVVQTNSPSEGEFAAATVVAQEDCVLYFWSFKRLRALIEQYPSLGRAFERALSDDLNRKMVTTMQVEPGQRYQMLLSAAIMDGEPSEAGKNALAVFRQQYNLTMEDHAAALAKVGWTANDFDAGYKGAPSVSLQQQYQKLVAAALAGTDTVPLSDEKRTDLRVFRLRNGINSNAHLAALRKVGWTVDEYEIGSKNPTLASQKEYNAIVANERTQRRSRIRSAIFSYIFPASSNQEQQEDLVASTVSAQVSEAKT